MKYSFKVSNCSFMKNKKAIMALDALIGTVLSVIALFFLLQLMYIFFFQDNDPNLKIAKNDAQSIVDFVNTYSSDNKNNPYFDNENCFFILKLQNLENFQVQKDAKKTYSYVITSNGVLILDNENVKNFEENYQLTPSMIKKEYKFDKSIQIRKDETPKDAFAKVTIFFIFDIGTSNDLKLSDSWTDVSQYIYLKQKENIIGKSFNNNNILNIFIPEKGYINNAENFVKDGVIGGYPKNFKLQNGNYLVFSRNYHGPQNLLFATNTEVSEIYIKNNLCSNKFINDKNRKKNMNKEENLLNIDYISKRVIFSCVPEGQSEIKLVWENGYKCEDKNSDCIIFLSQIDINKYSSLFKGDDPRDTNFKDFCNKFSRSQYKFEVIDSKEQVNSEKKIEFNILFNKDSSSFDGKKIESLSNKEKENYSFLDSREITDKIAGKKFTDCDYNEYKDLCFDIYLKNNKIYQYVKSPNYGENLEFYSFNENFLRKKKDASGKDIIYLVTDLSSSLKYESVSLDTYGSAISKSKGWLQTFGAILGGGIDDKNIYRIEIINVPIENSYEKKTIIIYLTPMQYTNIRDLNDKDNELIEKALAEEETSLQNYDPNLVNSNN